MIRASIGVKYNTTAAENLNIYVLRFPINVMPFLQFNKFRIGAGITSHQGARFKGDGGLPDVDFTSPIGARVEIGYSWFAVTYTAVDYETPLGESFDASSFGMSFSFTLPN